MKSLNQWLNIVRPSMPVISAVGRMIKVDTEVPELARFERGEISPTGHSAYVIPNEQYWPRHCPRGVPMSAWLAAVRYWMAEPSRVASAWTLTNFFDVGPKVYFPTKKQFTALAFADANFPFEQYHQPFSTFVIRIPDGTYENVPQQPKFAIGRYQHFPEQKVLAFSLCCVCGDGVMASMLTSYFGCDYGRYPAMGDVIKKSREGYSEDRNVVDEWSVHMTNSEQDILEQVQSAFVNVCMLMTPGCQKVGSANPVYEAELRTKLLKKKLPDSVRESVARDLQMMPMVYSLNQDIKIYEEETESKQAGEGGHSGVVVTPHWRRGHWRQQAYGQQMALRRAKFIPAVLVNGARFGGESVDSVTSYRVKS